MAHQRCTFCVMDTSDPWITFDDLGRCHHCRNAEVAWQPFRRARQQLEIELDRRIDLIKSRNRTAPYDCIIGLSGGVDSSYALLRAKQMGLRILAVHCDTGWNSETGVHNIYSLVTKLNVDLETLVVDWEQIRQLQVAFFKASVPNCDIPQDHAIMVTNNYYARKYGVRDFISGGNLQSESILPASWGHEARDLIHLKAIGRRFSNVKINRFPTMNIFEGYFYYPYILGIQSFRLLNYLDYDRDKAKKELMEAVGWRDYGGKHHESLFTKFFQAHYLPTKFGFDKRLAHLSSQIVAGQVTRNEALEHMKDPLYSSNDLRRDTFYFLEKLELSQSEWQQIMEASPKPHSAYPTHEMIKRPLRTLKNVIEARGFEVRKSW